MTENPLVKEAREYLTATIPPYGLPQHGIGRRLLLDLIKALESAERRAEEAESREKEIAEAVSIVPVTVLISEEDGKIVGMGERNLVQRVMQMRGWLDDLKASCEEQGQKKWECRRKLNTLLPHLRALGPLVEAGRKATQGEWYGPHFADEESGCDCKYILSPGFAGCIAELDFDNGMPIANGGNDAPPRAEAAANGNFIVLAANARPHLEALVAAAKEAPDAR